MPTSSLHLNTDVPIEILDSNQSCANLFINNNQTGNPLGSYKPKLKSMLTGVQQRTSSPIRQPLVNQNLVENRGSEATAVEATEVKAKAAAKGTSVTNLHENVPASSLHINTDEPIKILDRNQTYAKFFIIFFFVLFIFFF
jgi:hypothetical protein